MKIALIGYGKMGKAIEEIGLSKGHEFPLKINGGNLDEFTNESLEGIDVAIEFTTPDTAFANLRKLFENKIPTVCGTTAWLDKKTEAESICKQNETAFLYASNFSVGVNIFFEVNKQLAQIMNDYPDYNPSLEEIHHTAKLDAPSGTAVTLAEGLLEKLNRKLKWTNAETQDVETLSIISKREDPAPGTHSITYASDIDSIEIKHTAHSRKGFASGALLAAEFLANKQGIFSMKDVLF
jgi:4-hydroxy-tetrahydrodipicolinate reductase